MKNKIIPLLLVLILGIGGLVGWQRVKASPKYSVYKMYKAVESRDYATFTKYFDVDSVVNNLIDEVMDIPEMKGARGDEWTQLGNEFTESLIMIMKPALKEEARVQIRKSVEEGEFNKEYKPDSLINAFTNIEVKKDGKVADVMLVRDEADDTVLKMRKMEGYWQVFKMDMPLPEISEEKIKDETTQTVKFGNRADIGEGWFLTVEEPELFDPPDYWVMPKENNKYVASVVTYENTTAESGRFSLFNLRLKDTEDHSYSIAFAGKEPALESGRLEARGTVRGYVTYEILEDSEVKSIVYSGNYKTVVFEK